MDIGAATAELHRMLTAALELADRLDMPMIAIHVDEARDLVTRATILIVSTPVYRATYTALTKAIFDLQPQDALRGTVVVPIAVGHGPHHALSVDHGLRPLIASLGGLTTPSGVYATAADFDDDGRPGPDLEAQVHRATAEAVALRAALRT